MRMRRRTAGVAAFAISACALGVSTVSAQQFALPANDLLPLLDIAGLKSTTLVPVQSNPEPPLVPVPRARCAPGSRPLEGIQGRVSAAAVNSPEAANGWTCNTEPVSRHRGAGGGWKTWRYVDRQGNECAYYDAAAIGPFGAIKVPGLRDTGVVVLDMSDPAHPRQTDLLTEVSMQAPHESLNLNRKRGLLAAEMGSAGTAPGLLAIYRIKDDCRRPVHLSTRLVAPFGHESGFSPDGRTFWIGGGVGLAAIDVTNPRAPKTLWEGAVYTHGMSVSQDGDRVYLADPINGHLTILDSSEIQARRPDPQVREISRLTWKTVSIPQSTAPMTINGKPYVLEFDEFAFRFTGLPQDFNQVGAARIIDISDERHPRIASNLRLQVNQRDTHAGLQGDPGTRNPAQSYAAHYCAIPRRVDPEIVACSFLGSGLRIFNITKPRRPREVGYYVAPPEQGLSNALDPSNYAASQPAFAPGRREVWYTDLISGFHSVRLNRRAWPNPTAPRRSRRAPTPRLPRSSGPVVPQAGDPGVRFEPELVERIGLICRIGLPEL